MNGLEALQALKDGKTVKFTNRYIDVSRGEDFTDTVYYRYRSRMKDGSSMNYSLWCRREDEWVWIRQKEICLPFWMDTADGFEIAEEEE